MKKFAQLLKLAGALLIFASILGGVFGLFDYSVTISGAALPVMDWYVSVICTVIGILIYGSGHLLAKKYGDVDEESFERPNLDINNLGFIVKALRKTRKRNFIMGLFMTLFGITMILIGIFSEEGTGIMIGLCIFGWICILIGIVGFYQFSKLKSIEDSEIYKLIMLSPATITGLTAQVFSSGYGKIGQAINANIIVGKKTKAVLSVTETDLELLKQYLEKYNPNLVYEKKSV